MWIWAFAGGGKRRGRVRILRTAAGDCGGGMVRGLRALCASHRRIADARARMPARWRIADGLSWGAEGQLMTHYGHSLTTRTLQFLPAGGILRVAQKYNSEIKVATNEELEIYKQRYEKQRYETYRHLDKLRWQMLQIAVAAGSVVLVFGGGAATGPEWWVLAIVGLLLVIFGFVMERIRHGISANGSVLKNVGELVGDVGVPQPVMWCKSSSFWVAFAIISLGILCFAFALIRS